MNNIIGKTTEIIEEKELRERIGKLADITGSVYKIRKMSGFSFVILRTARNLIQCVLDTGNITCEELCENASVKVKGMVRKEERAHAGFEIDILEIEILSLPAAEVPVVINNREVKASLETKLDYRVITLRNHKERAVFKIQEGILAGARKFLMEKKFTEIHSPKIVFSGVEGGANMFGLQYFGKEAYLAQSPQAYKQMMVAVFDRVFEIGAVYRAEKHDTARHLNEYIGLDLEMGYISSFYEIMETETAMLQTVMAYLKENCREELELLEVNLPAIDSIPSISFKEAKEWIQKEFNRNTEDDYDFEPEEERLLCQLIKEKTGCEFVFVTHYPTAKRPFYAMEEDGDKEVTKSFDLLFRGIEVTTGGQRIHDYHAQTEKMKERGMNTEAFESYLMLHKYGIAPHGGFGMGVERFTMSLLGKTNVREAALFPRDMNRLVP
ncbi:aspartate--tRNA(Asn) ligase [Anaerocolumna xylanovorans]|uniref:Aspartate--tRNA ligase n=1 Tax=Anaerocolumna xylanovorans DSM 12503 TaxID=1121345 RepID=A0A1M7YLL4_9FIRM|nr:aspartate--tRNA(Asn) ligase [Anaerocolumna xylanovorans]SHO53514.1 nondiscriminating aspartyl-tRNA synthetase [Anaerocolumna xylanovorans DSM 12503]